MVERRIGEGPRVHERAAAFLHVRTKLFRRVVTGSTSSRLSCSANASRSDRGKARIASRISRTVIRRSLLRLRPATQTRVPGIPLAGGTRTDPAMQAACGGPEQGPFP
jgi:hypothetical protein